MNEYHARWQAMMIQEALARSDECGWWQRLARWLSGKPANTQAWILEVDGRLTSYEPDGLCNE